jgi:cytochrome P450
MSVHRLPELFGDDADEFNVYRWMRSETKEQGVGVYGNMLTFSHGPRACIGA